ncbi:host-nuclease inhibitor Gam family protein, partial [Escherichia coli]
RMGLERFIRTKEEVNKQAILAEPDAVKGIAGIKVNKGAEGFEVEPFEQDAGLNK